MSFLARPVLRLRPEVNGGMTTTMPMGLASTMVLRPRVAVVVLLGRVMGLSRGLSWVLQVASLRGLLIRVFGSEEVTEAIVVGGAAEGAGTVHVPATTCCCRPDDSSRGC